MRPMQTAHSPFFLLLPFLPRLSAPGPGPGPPNSSIEVHPWQQHQLRGSSQQWRHHASAIVIVRPSLQPDRPQFHCWHRRRQCFLRTAARHSWSGASAVSLGIVFATDKFLKQAFVAASIKFPSALFGMFCVFSVLVVFDRLVPALTKALMDFFAPATLFIKRWLPLFYVPTLVLLPLAVRDVPAASGLKIFAITFGGWFATLADAGYTVLAVRKLVKTAYYRRRAHEQAITIFYIGNLGMGCYIRCIIWCCIFQSHGTWYHSKKPRTCLPFQLAANVLGYMVGSGLPAGVKKVLHPIISCALSADLAAVVYGYLSGSGLDAVLGDYFTKAPSNPGAGDVLMGFLGSVIISFAFSMFKQRKLVKRHAAEIFTSIAIASTFSLYSTVVIGRLIGLEPSLTISILPRCITVALVLSIVSFFEDVNSTIMWAVEIERIEEGEIRLLCAARVERRELWRATATDALQSLSGSNKLTCLVIFISLTMLNQSMTL